MREIGTGFNGIANILINVFTNIFNTLESITIGGISLLQIILTIMILSALIPLLFTIPGGAVIESKNYARNEKRKKEMRSIKKRKGK